MEHFVTNSLHSTMENVACQIAASSFPFIGKPLSELPGEESRALLRQWNAGDTVVVIGADIAGLSAALGLSRDKNLHVVVLEDRDICQVLSSRSLGHVLGLQVPEQVIFDCCDKDRGQELISQAKSSVDLVRQVIDAHAIKCDMRDGYIEIGRDGRQIVTQGCGKFGVAPYAYITGLAAAAQQAGVSIHDKTPVTNIRPAKFGYRVQTAQGPIIASHVVVAGSGRMARTIPALNYLCKKMAEVRWATIVTAPIPEDVLRSIMPEGAGFPFASDFGGFGSVDSENRIVFGSRLSAFGNPKPRLIERDLLKLFPALAAGYARATSNKLQTRLLGDAQTLSVTGSFLPYVDGGRRDKGVLHVDALGPHDIALGTMLGFAVADQVQHLGSQQSSQNTTTQGLPLAPFASIEHGQFPTWKPLRNLVTQLGVRMARTAAARLQPT